MHLVLATRRRAAAPSLLPALVALVLLSAAACTGPPAPDPGPTTPPPPEVTALAVDPALDARRGGGEHARDWNLAARSADLDALAAAVVTTPGNVPEVGLWRWAVEAGVPRVDADLDVPGAVRDVALAVVDGRAVVAGTTVVGRRAESFVRVSDDTLAWRTAPVHPSSVRLTEATSGGGVPHLAGTTADGAVVWAEAGGDVVDVAEVVPAAAGTHRTVVDMAASGAFGDQDVVAILYRETAQDGVGRPVVVARDATGAWGSPVLVDPRPRVQVNGIRVRLGGGWTTTGAAPLGPETFGALRPTAWTTVDGVSWATIDADYLGDSAWLAGADEDWVLGKPSETGRAVPMWQVGGRRVASLIGDDDADGLWGAQFGSDPAPVSGVTGVLEYPHGGAPFVFVTGSGYTSVGGWAPPGYTDEDSSWWPVADVSAVSPPTAVLAAQDGAAPGGQVAVQALTDSGEWWRTSWASTAFSVGTDGPVAAPAPVAAVEGAVWRDAAALDGRRLFVHWRPDGDVGNRATTTLVSPGAAEVSADLGSSGAGVEDLAHDGRRWVLVGSDAPSILTTAVDRPTVWTSGDAAAWTRLELDVGDAREGAAQAVCQDGALLVGWSTAHDGTTQPQAWRLTGDGTQRVPHGVEPAADAWFDDCSTHGGTTFVHGRVGELDVLWRVSADGAFEEVHRAPAGTAFGAPVPVGDGWVAWGEVDGDEESGPVVWWSPDGAAWTPVPLPADAPVADGTVVVDGAGVVAVAWGASGIQAWRVSGLRAGARG